MPKYTFTITQIIGPYGNKYSLLTANEIRFGAASLSIIFCADIGPKNRRIRKRPLCVTRLIFVEFDVQDLPVIGADACVASLMALISVFAPQIYQLAIRCNLYLIDRQ